MADKTETKTVDEVAKSSLQQAVNAIQVAKSKGHDHTDPLDYATACALTSIAARLSRLPRQADEKSIFEHVFGK